MGEREFLTRVAGSLFSGVVLDAGMEAVWALDKEYWSGKFPYVSTIEPYLPPADDWLVLAGSVAPWLIGRFGKKKWAKLETLEPFGEGALMYSAPMIVHHIIARTMMAHVPRGEFTLRRISGQLKPQLR